MNENNLAAETNESVVRKIEVHPYDPRWAEPFAKETELLRNVFQDNPVTIHHIGSTAVPGLKAKPIIDMLHPAGYVKGKRDLALSLEQKAMAWKERSQT
ncbi:GrpB family protein [Brevibacillus parabrevis]|uniref:GrpB family protein n=1 Tax=Brevibacillus parabrevis TaxID=54914 RepID=UPI002E1D7BC5|nr:GrpB family protein [Brevibacillus parabrevis]